ncbi:MAG: hypothetical protein Q9168_006523 [Polycauliona sp. 1 TL-2023]
MPVTIKTASHGAKTVSMAPYFLAISAQSLYDQGQHRDAKHEHLLQSSFPNQLFERRNTYASPNGFVYSAIKAYNVHHHLTIRPEDIWFAILAQFNCWLNKAAEDVRKQFVAHEGKKELTIVYNDATRYTVDFGDFAKQMSRKVEENVVDKELREWMMPGFSTTTDTDTVVASVYMMGALQAFFGFTCQTECGIPSVTLMGVKSDWEILLQKLEKLVSFGKEPAHFATLLKPICERFVECFDAPQSAKVKEFWSRIVSEVSEESGQSFYKGWITAFCFWDKDGNNLYDKALDNRGSRPDAVEYEGDLFEDEGYGFEYEVGYPQETLELDGVRYHAIDSGDVPPGTASVPVKLIDNGLDGKFFETSLVAGSVGMQFTASGGNGTEGLDSVQPLSGWWMFIDREVENDGGC